MIVNIKIGKKTGLKKVWAPLLEHENTNLSSYQLLSVLRDSLSEPMKKK